MGTVGLQEQCVGGLVVKSPMHAVCNCVGCTVIALLCYIMFFYLEKPDGSYQGAIHEYIGYVIGMYSSWQSCTSPNTVDGVHVLSASSQTL